MTLRAANELGELSNITTISSSFPPCLFRIGFESTLIPIELLREKR
jgi:hypothetical protein